MNQLQTAQDNQGFALSQDDLQTLEQAGIIPNGTPVAQVKMFAKVCSEFGLSPFKKQIYLLGYKKKGSNAKKYTIITGIDGFRDLSKREGNYAGISDAQYNRKGDGTFLTLFDCLDQKIQVPTTCTITVYKIVKGARVPFTSTVAFKEFTQNQQKWLSMPFHMIAKVAEAHALRKAFDLSGVFLEEEAHKFSEDTPIVDLSEEQMSANQSKQVDEMNRMIMEIKTYPLFCQFYFDNSKKLNDPSYTDTLKIKRGKLLDAIKEEISKLDTVEDLEKWWSDNGYEGNKNAGWVKPVKKILQERDEQLIR